MIAVADTSPLCYLIVIGEVGLLPQLFDQVLIPPAVIAELRHPDAPPTVREWAENLPPWISVAEGTGRMVPGLEKLQSGEREAIMLADSRRADLILLDEKAERRVAAEAGLGVTGLFGILGDAALKGLVHLAGAIDRLRFRCSPALLEATLDRFGGGHRQ